MGPHGQSWRQLDKRKKGLSFCSFIYHFRNCLVSQVCMCYSTHRCFQAEIPTLASVDFECHPKEGVLVSPPVVVRPHYNEGESLWEVEE